MNDVDRGEDPLVAATIEAFRGSPQPSNDELLHPRCMDDCDILEFYGGVRWEDMSDEMVIRGYAAPIAFSPKAFRYYLPAYLIWTIRNPDSIEYAGEAILRSLDPGTPKELLHDFMKSHFEAMEAPQIEAVRAFLWRMSEHRYLGEYALAALANHWDDARAT